jgi:multiple sugar transport system substrate-binding protein
MKGKSVFLFLLLLVLSAGLFASGQRGGQVQGGALEVWHRWGEASVTSKIFQEVIDAFQSKNPDITVTIVSKTGDYHAMIEQALLDASAGIPLPDGFLGGFEVMNYIHTQMGPTKIDALAPSATAYREFAARFAPNIWKIGEDEGEQISIPYAVSVPVLYINEDIFKAAGIPESDYPKTMDDIQRVSAIIKEKTGKYGIFFKLNSNYTDLSYIYSNGGRILSPDGKKVDLTSPETIEYFKLWQTMFSRGLVPPGNQNEGVQSFMAGETAMMAESITSYSGFVAQIDWKIKILPFPSFGNKPVKLSAGAAAYYSFTKDKSKYNAVWRLLDYLYSVEGISTFIKTNYLSPILAPVPIGPGQEMAYESLKNAVPWINWPGGAAGLEVNRIYNSRRMEITQSNQDIAQALRQLETDCNRLISAQ